MNEKAQQIWDNAKPADDSHSFCARWQIKASGARMAGSGTLLMVPMRDTARLLRNIAYVDVMGNATFLLADSNIHGLYYGLNGRKEAIAIAHEFVTGVKYHELTGNAVAIAFCAENVPHVAKAMLEKYPTTRVFLIEDLDVGMDRNAVAASANAASAIVDETGRVPETGRGHDLDPSADAQKLHNWIQRKGVREITAKLVMQRGPNSVRNAVSAKGALRFLVEKGLLATEDGKRYRTLPEGESAIPEETTCSA